MAPGPPDLGTNRFAILSESPPRKRKPNNKTFTTDLFPSLPSTPAADPKFLILKSVKNTKTLTQFSCFAVYRSLLLISNEILSISELRDGNLLLLVKNSTVATKFLKATSLTGICQIEANLHENLNVTKGTVYAPFLNDIPESEIINELKDFGVVNAYKFQKTIEGKQKPSGVILLSFNLYSLPSSINIAWRKVNVRQYFPNPMRCKTCQLLGHTEKYCKSTPSCVHCNLPPHSPNACSRSFCANCFADHSASSPSCPKFQQAKEILKIKTTDKCSIRDALKKYKQLNPIQIQTQTFKSYSAAAASSIDITETNTNTSTINNKINLSSSKKDNSSTNTNNVNYSNLLASNKNLSKLQPNTAATSTKTTTTPNYTTTTLTDTLIYSNNKKIPHSLNTPQNNVTQTIDIEMTDNANNCTATTINTKNLSKLHPNTAATSIKTTTTPINTTTTLTDTLIHPNNKNTPHSLNILQNNVTQTIDIEMTDNANNSNNEDTHTYNLRSLAK